MTNKVFGLETCGFDKDTLNNVDYRKLVSHAHRLRSRYRARLMRRMFRALIRVGGRALLYLTKPARSDGWYLWWKPSH